MTKADLYIHRGALDTIHHPEDHRGDLMTDQPEYESVRILRLQPGDVVVVRIAVAITKKQSEDIRGELKPKFPGHLVLVLGAGADIEIIRDGDDA